MNSNFKSNIDIVNENLNILKKIINLEISKSYDNKSVVGEGLDGYFETNAQYFSILIRNYQDKYGGKPIYSTLNVSARKIFCDRFLKEINELLVDRKMKPKSNVQKNKNLISKNKEITLNSNLKSLGRVSTKVINMFRKQGVESLSDVLSFYPRRHRDFNDIKKVNQLIPGEIQTVVLTVWEAKTIRYRNGVMQQLGSWEMKQAMSKCNGLAELGLLIN